ncbi:MAG: toprim domain-containing protein [Archaeoglobaceae archaeon]|nr:toprim domain-containing protein [Archaeoglobaceae archaeon]
MEELKELSDAIEELRELSKNGWLVVVEGIRDAKSLRELGIEGEIVVFSGFLSTAEKIKSRKVILLTDFDSEGFEIEKGLFRALLSYGNVPNIELKRKIFRCIKKDITKVEELSGFLKREMDEL